MSCFCEVVYKIFNDKCFLFAKWEFQLCEVCTGLTRGCCSSTHENRLLSDIFRLMISQEVWRYTYFQLIGHHLSIYKLFNSSKNNPKRFNFARAYRHCSVLLHAKFWFGPSFLMFPWQKKTKKEKMSQFGCVLCHILAKMFPPSMLETDWVLHRLNTASSFCHIIIIFFESEISSTL